MHRSALVVGSLLVCAASLAADIRINRETYDGIELSLAVEAPRFTRTFQAGEPATRIAIDGVESDGEPGGPELPRLSRFIAVPAGTRAELVSVTADDAPIALRSVPAFAEPRRRHCGGPRETSRRSEIAYEAALEAPFVTVSESSYLGAVKAALVTFAPVSLQADGVRAARNITARIRFVPVARAERAPVTFVGLPEDGARLYRTIFANAAALPPLSLDNARKVDLVIAAKRYRDTLRELVDFKERQGREVRVKYFDHKPTHAEVKAIIAAEYAKTSPPVHTLIVGNIDEIPSHRKSDYWSDYPYALLDAGDYPDLSIARFPVQSDAELSAMITKVVARETRPRDNGAFLVTSGFETSWCQVNLQFIMDNIFAHSPVPLSITKLYASDGAKTDRILEGYNANPNIVIYDGHGNAKGMTEIPLLMEHLPRLTNSVYPIVFDIACLNSYWPSTGAATRNFADTLVTMDGTGAAGILAASHNSGGHDLFRHIFRASIHDEAAPATPHGLNEVGSAVLYGKLKYLEQLNGASNALTDNWLFYYHGDPASTIFAP